MVATTTPTLDLPKLSPRKLRFARALSQGSTQAQAYRLACPNRDITESTAQSEGCKWANSPAVKAKVQELLIASDTATTLRISERRALLAETARSARGPASHSDRISALKLDAQLAGDLDSTAPVVSINFSSALDQVRQTFSPVLDIEQPTPRQSLVSVADTGGAPISEQGFSAMGGNPESASEKGLFTTDSLLGGVNCQMEKNETVTVFTNELGEEEEV